MALVLFGCDSGQARRKKLESGYPLERAVAAVQVAGAGDMTAIHQLVDMLEDPDSGVRFFAIQALVRLTGNDYGYKYWESEAARAEALERWRDAIRKNEIRIVRETSETAAGEGPENRPSRDAAALTIPR